ncbi:hypothetical protein B0H10DRAFT_2234422 [Mycena sp. CBHHK59/15]|nr:hypothetical protein B0H10DRAFT_2234422 [Mycena sp. CBHHK59/15]
MSSTPPAPPTTPGTVYKGKVTHRLWPQLPAELVRLIATFFLLDVSSTAHATHLGQGALLAGAHTTISAHSSATRASLATSS